MLLVGPGQGSCWRCEVQDVGLLYVPTKHARGSVVCEFKFTVGLLRGVCICGLAESGVCEVDCGITGRTAGDGGLDDALFGDAGCCWDIVL